MSVYIHGGLRSPIGVLNGQYKYMRPEILGAQLIDELINRHTISQVDGIFCGNAVGTGGNITTGNAAQSSVFVTIIKPATPNRYTTGIVITIERHA